VADHFLVGALIAFSHLNDSIEDKDITVGDTFEDKDVLVFTLSLVQDLLNLEGHCLAGPQSSSFVEPSIDDEVSVLD